MTSSSFRVCVSTLYFKVIPGRMCKFDYLVVIEVRMQWIPQEMRLLGYKRETWGASAFVLVALFRILVKTRNRGHASSTEV